MRDARESCAHTGDGCLRCEVVPAAIGRSGDALLLAPLDGSARESLVGALTAGQMNYKFVGASIVEVLCNDTAKSEIIQELKLRLSPMLQQRIKGVFFEADRPQTPDLLLGVFMHAEPLSVLFDLMDVEWVRTVLREDRLFSVYHPMVDARSGDIFAYEALIRGHHPHVDEVVGAGRLIYACEKLNLQNALDQQARVTALRDSNVLDLERTKLFMNFLPSSIYDPDICLRSTMAAARERGIPLDRLVFEVIEAEEVQSMDGLRRIVRYYREHGAGIALDNISSGFASLQLLADLLPDYAKIDGHLVAQAAESASARQTLESIASLARKLNVKVIAEGIETMEQMRVCVEAGADYLQGYLFARPAAVPETVYLPLPMLATAA